MINIPDTEIVQDFNGVARDNRGLYMFSVYYKPKDYPDGYIARMYVLDQPTNLAIVSDTLDDIRNRLPMGLYCLKRQRGDHPNVVETWF